MVQAETFSRKNVVDNSARGPDYYIHSSSKSLQLFINWFSTVNCCHLQIIVRGQLSRFFAHLQSQFPSGNQNKHLWFKNYFQFFKYRNKKSGSFSSSCLGLSDNVFAF